MSTSTIIRPVCDPPDVGRDQSGSSILRALAAVANLKTAETTSREFGVALGILIAGPKMTTAQAFDLPGRVSQYSHRKLRHIAFEVTVSDAIDLPPGVPLIARTVSGPARAATMARSAFDQTIPER
jgi:hypothetical protein